MNNQDGSKEVREAEWQKFRVDALLEQCKDSKTQFVVVDSIEIEGLCKALQASQPQPVEGVEDAEEFAKRMLKGWMRDTGAAAFNNITALITARDAQVERRVREECEFLEKVLAQAFSVLDDDPYRAEFEFDETGAKLILRYEDPDGDPFTEVLSAPGPYIHTYLSQQTAKGGGEDA